MHDEKMKIFIYGSCVSRDSFEIFSEKVYLLSGYIARQSLVSSFSGGASPLNWNTDSKLVSKFQNDMLNGDIASSLPEVLRKVSGEIDLLLCDFVDERGGLLVTDSGDILTDTLGLRQSGFLDQFHGAFRHIRFGSDEHFDLWKNAFVSFHSLLFNLGLDKRTVVIKNDWALETVQGDVFPLEGSRMEPHKVNGLFQRYFDFVREFTAIEVIEVPSSLCLGTSDHRWGVAPFHYASPFYRFVESRVDARMKER